MGSKKENRAKIISLVEKEVPDMAKAIKDMHDEHRGSKKSPPTFAIHQDSFAGDYQPEELLLLGAVIKYAGMHGIPIAIRGKDQETIKQNYCGNGLTESEMKSAQVGILEKSLPDCEIIKVVTESGK